VGEVEAELDVQQAFLAQYLEEVDLDA